MIMPDHDDYLRQYGGRLLEMGYDIVPIYPGTKYPKGLPNWQHTRATPGDIESWLAGGFARGGAGVLTEHFPAVDIDVLDPVLAARLVDWCHQNIGWAPRRVGRAPKVLLPYRTDTPFPKLASRRFIDPAGEIHKVEILGRGGQFVAYATHPDTGLPYQWPDADELVDLPAEQLPAISADQARALIVFFESLVPESWTPVSDRAEGVAAGGGDVWSHAKPPLDITAEQAETALAALDPDMRMVEWVKVGMACHHQFAGAETGFGLWNAWSAQGVKYDAQEMRVRWRSFAADLRSTNPTTFATILKWSKDAGVLIGKRKPAPGTPLGEFLERYVFIEVGNRVCDLTKGPHVGVTRIEEFRNATANVRHDVPAPTDKDPDKTKVVPVHSSWLINAGRLTAQGTEYVPAKGTLFEEHGLLWVNECHMPAFPAGAGSTGVFHDHMAYLFPVDAEREWFIDWMAFNVQRPEQRCKVTPLHVARPHGTGRGWVVELMQKLLGSWNCTKTKMAVLCGEGSSGAFQDYLHRTLFCAIEEVREGHQRFAVSDRIRDVLTENTLEVNRKYGTKQTQRVYTNFFFMTNHPDALVLKQEDRRVNVFSGPDAPRGADYYTRLYGWLEAEDGVAALHVELMARDLSTFNWHRAMETEARRAMIDNNRTPTETLFHELLESPPAPAMTFRQVVAALVALDGGDAFTAEVDETQVVKLLQHHAVQARKMKIEGQTIRPWTFDRSVLNDSGKIRAAVESISSP